MRSGSVANVFHSDDRSLPTSDLPMVYPVNSFLSCTLSESDIVHVILLAKDGQYSHCSENAELFKNELDAANQAIGAHIRYSTVTTSFVQNDATHRQMLDSLVREIEPKSHLIADITFGPKDVPLIIFTALTFAEQQLQCDVDNILYGKADFMDGRAINTELCDVSSLYYLSSISSTVQCNDPDKAKKMLTSLLSL